MYRILFSGLLLSSAQAFAQEGAEAAVTGPAMASQFLMLGGFFLLFYLMIWRPQSQRAKEHRHLLSNLTKGDEVVTAGGVLGKIAKLEEQYLVLAITDNTDIVVQRQSITQVLPKGTLKQFV